MSTRNSKVSGCYCSSLVDSRCDFCTETRKLVRNFDQGEWSALVLTYDRKWCFAYDSSSAARWGVDISSLPLAERTVNGGPIVNFNGLQYAPATGYNVYD